MHIVRFQGGFANQLFQLALYEKLKEDYGKDRVKADLSFYRDHNDHGGFKLSRFFRLDLSQSAQRDHVTVDEESFEVMTGDTSLLNGGKDLYYSGYWQEKRLFTQRMTRTGLTQAI